MTAATCPACRTTVPVPAATRDGTVGCPACGHDFVPDPHAPEPPPPTPPRVFPVSPYRPTRSGSPLGIGIAGAAGMIAALVLAFVCVEIRAHGWLVLIAPILHGLAVGLVVGLAARFGRARFPVEVGVVGAACGLVSYLLIHYLEYAAVAAAGAPVGFREFLDLRAQFGVRLGRAGRGLGYGGSILYWCVEAGLTAAAAAIAGWIVKAPLCERCGRWKTSRQFGPYLLEPDAALAAVESGCPEGMAVPLSAPGSVKLTLHYCDHCGLDATAEVEAEGSKKVATQFVTRRTAVSYPGEAVMAFEGFDRSLIPPG